MKDTNTNANSSSTDWSIQNNVYIDEDSIPLIFKEKKNLFQIK